MNYVPLFARSCFCVIICFQYSNEYRNTKFKKMRLTSCEHFCLLKFKIGVRLHVSENSLDKCIHTHTNHAQTVKVPYSMIPYHRSLRTKQAQTQNRTLPNSHMQPMRRRRLNHATHTSNMPSVSNKKCKVPRNPDRELRHTSILEVFVVLRISPGAYIIPLALRFLNFFLSHVVRREKL